VIHTFKWLRKRSQQDRFSSEFLCLIFFLCHGRMTQGIVTHEIPSLARSQPVFNSPALVQNPPLWLLPLFGSFPPLHRVSLIPLMWPTSQVSDSRRSVPRRRLLSVSVTLEVLSSDDADAVSLQVSLGQKQSYTHTMT
jgi:hypothetical protein